MNFKNPILWLTFLLKPEEQSIDGKSELNVIQKTSIADKPYIYRLLDKKNPDIIETIIKNSNPKYDVGILKELTNSNVFFTKAKEYFTSYFNLMILGLSIVSTNTLQYFFNKNSKTNKDASIQHNTHLGDNQNKIPPMTKEEIMENYSSSSSDDGTVNSADDSEQSGKNLPQPLAGNNENILHPMAKNTKKPALSSLKMNNSSIRSNTLRGTCQNIANRITLSDYSDGSSDYVDEYSDDSPQSVQNIIQSMASNNKNIPTPMAKNTKNSKNPALPSLPGLTRSHTPLREESLSPEKSPLFIKTW